MRLQDAAIRGTRLIRAKLTGALVPFHVVACVTAKCNLKCVYCSCPSLREEEMTVGEWCRALDECKALGTERVQFFGGEPLLRKDLGDIVAHARGLGLRCALATNGTLVPERRDVVTQMHTVVMSLDGDEAAHDVNRGRFSHHATVKAIHALKEWGVPVKVNAVVNVNNVDQLEWLAAFTRANDVPLTFNVMRSEPVGLWNDAEHHRMGDEGVRSLIDRILAIKRRHSHVLFSDHAYHVLRRWPDFTRDRMTADEGGDRYAGPSCSAGRLHCSIYTDGRLFPCNLTVKQLPALDVRKVGVAAALEAASRHTCVSCASACMIEVNNLFALEPRALATLARAYMLRAIE